MTCREFDLWRADVTASISPGKQDEAGKSLVKALVVLGAIVVFLGLLGSQSTGPERAGSRETYDPQVPRPSARHAASSKARTPRRGGIPRPPLPRVEVPAFRVPQINVPQVTPPRIMTPSTPRPRGTRGRRGNQRTQRLRPTLTLDNKSGMHAEVKVVGATRVVVHVPSGQRRTVTLAGGSYSLYAKYGSGERAIYSRGDNFHVTQTSMSVSRITITLHTVIGGNYSTRSISAGAYNQQ